MSFKASVEVIVLFLSIFAKDNGVGLDPVAITAFLKDISFSKSKPLTFIVDESIKDPMPLYVVILFLLIKNSIPFVVCSTTESFLEIIFFKSTFNSPLISIP